MAKPIYTDIDLSFRQNTITGDLNKKFDVNAVKQSLRAIFLTNPYEKPFQPRFGIGMQSMLFENIDPVMSAVLRRNIQDQINEYEPRCSVDSINVSDDGVNGIIINLNFHAIGNPSLSPQTLSITLERTR